MTIGRANADQAGARPYLHRWAGTRFKHADRPITRTLWRGEGGFTRRFRKESAQSYG